MMSEEDTECHSLGSSILTEDIPGSDFHFDFMKLLYWCLDTDGDQIKPSEYRSQLELSIKERYDSVVDLSKRKPMPLNEFCTSSKFSILPSLLVLQNFIPYQTYKFNIRITNLLHTTQSLAVSSFPLPASVFKVTYDTKIRNLKVAPGMTVVLKLEFCPQQNSDLLTHLELRSNSETFHVPVLVLGPRPLLDLPDTLELSRTSPKIETVRNVQVKNIGTMVAEFSLSVKNPFSVSPSKIFLRPGEEVPVSLKCKPLEPGDFQSKLLAKFDTGEFISASIQCPCSNLKLSLSTSHLDFGLVPLGLRSVQRFEIVNNSEQPIQFRLVKNADLQHDLADIDKLKDCCDLIKDNEQTRYNVLKYQDLGSDKCHEVIYDRLYSDELALLRPTDDLFLFSSDVIDMEPLSGTVWSHTSAIIAVTFHPLECRGYQISAYCDMTGFDARHALTFEGHGLGPKFTLSASQICLDYFVCSSKAFEIYITNVGDIVGTIDFPAQTLVFGGSISCCPAFAEMEALSSRVFRLEIRSEFVGDFTERIRFHILESHEELCLDLSGTVRSVSLNLSKPVIDFGNVSFGFPTCRLVEFCADSPEHVSFEIWLEDGNKSAVTYEDYLSVPYTHCRVPDSPREFLVEPTAGVLAPGASQTVKMTLTCNTFGQFSSQLKCELPILKSLSSVVTILYNCQPCTVECQPKLIVYDQAFIGHEYSFQITLNCDCLDRSVAFQYVPSPESESKIQLCLSHNKGVLTSSKNLTVKFMANKTGLIQCPIKFHFLGAETTMQCSMLEVTGCGPLLSTSSEVLEFGEIPLLTLETRTLQIQNASPIKASFSANIVRPCKNWSISPQVATVAPFSTAEIAINIIPVESGLVSNILCIKGRHFENITVKVSAFGVGYSILTKPNIVPEYDFGSIFTKTLVTFTITIQNFGARTFDLFWSSKADSSGALYRHPITKEHPTWSIAPSKCRLGPGEEEEVRIDVYSETPKEVTAQFFLLGFVDGDKMNLQKILKTSWHVVFITSTVVFTPEQLLFRVDHVSPDIRCVDSTDTIELHNPTGDTLYTKIYVRYPFYLTCNQDMIGVKSSDDRIKISSRSQEDLLTTNRTLSSEYITSSNSKSSGSQHTDGFMKESLKNSTHNNVTTGIAECYPCEPIPDNAVIQGIDFSPDSNEEIGALSFNGTIQGALTGSIDEALHSASDFSLHEAIHLNRDKAIRIDLPNNITRGKTELCCFIEPHARFKFQVHFDVDSCLDSLNSYVVQDHVFLDHKGVEIQDKIPLVAVINYPSVDLNPRLLSYETVSLYEHQAMQVILTNRSPFPIEYSFAWSADEWSVSYSKCDDKFVKKFKHELKKYSTKGRRRFQSQPQKFKHKIPLATSDPAAQAGKGTTVDAEEKAVDVVTSQASTDSSQSNVALAEALLIDPQQTLIEQIGDITSKFVDTISEVTLLNHKHKTADYKKLINIIVNKRFNKTDQNSQVLNQIVYIVKDICSQKDSHLYRMEYTGSNLTLEDSIQRNIMNTCFSFTPSSGTVGPYQTQIVEACFYPKHGMDITGKALCTITGSLCQELALQVSAHDVYYTVKPVLINLKCVKHGEKHLGKFKIFNKGHHPLVLDQSFLPIDKQNLQVQLKFSDLLVPPRSSTRVLIEYSPHAVGVFREFFHIIVADHPPLEMVLTGFNTFPQVLLHTFRSPYYPSLPVNHEYIALARYLYHCDHSPGNRAPLESEKIFQRRLSSTVQSGFSVPDAFDADWEILTQDKSLPSTSDIQVTLERACVAKYQMKTMTNLNTLHPDETIQTNMDQEVWPVKVAPYVIDFHNIPVGEPQVHCIVLFNPTHISAPILLNKGKQGQEYGYLGLTLLLKGDKMVGGNDVRYLVLNFTPSRTVFKQQSQRVQYSFYLDVSGGLSIELCVKATVCVPHLTVRPNELDFKIIRVNCVYNQFFAVENKGRVKVNWKISLKQPRVFGETAESLGVVFSTYQGVLSPGDIQFIQVVVYSNFPVSHNLDYIMYIKNGNEPVKIKVLANVVEPYVSVTKRKLDFGLRHPYSIEEGLTSELQNRNPFPVDVIFQYPRDTSVYPDEAKLVSMLFYYYKRDFLLIPSTYEETNFTPVLIDFYKELETQTTEWMQKKKKAESHIIEDETPPVIEEPPETKIESFPKTRKPSAAKSTRTKNKSSVGIKSSTSVVVDPIASDTTVRDEDIKDYIDTLGENNLLQDPLGLYASYPSHTNLDTDPAEKRGVGIICYSAPEIEGKLYATRLANQLNLECINIDDFVIDILIEHAASNDELCIGIVELINKTYDKIINQAVANKPPSTIPTGKTDGALVDQVGLRNKIDTILSHQPAPHPIQTVNKKSKRSLVEQTTSFNKNSDLTHLEDSLSQLLLTEGGILDKCRNRGVVISDLKSRIFSNSANLFLLLLKILTPSVKHLHLVVFHDSKDAYMKREKERNDLTEIYCQKLMNKKRKRLQSITPEQFAKLTDSEKDIYRDILKERKHPQENPKSEEIITEQKEPEAIVESTKEKSITKKKSKILKEESAATQEKSDYVEPPATLQPSSQISTNFDQYERLLSRLIKMAALWYPTMEDVLSLGLVTQEFSTANVNRAKSKGSIKNDKKHEKERAFTKDSEKAEADQGLPMFILNSALESLVAFYHLSDILERKKHAKQLELEKSQLPTSPNFWYLRKPTSSSLAQEFFLNDTAFCLQSPLLSSDTSAAPSSDTQGASDTDVFTAGSPVSLSSIKNPSFKSNTKLKKSPNKTIKKKEEHALLIVPAKKNQCETKLIKFTLDPGEKMPFIFSFNPSGVGQYEQDFEFVLNNYNTKATIKCVGLCILPDIVRSPVILFPQVIDHYSDLTAQNVFVMKTGIFFFGYVLVTDSTSGNVLRQEAEFNIRNASASSPIIVNFYWQSRRESTPSDEFGFDWTNVILEPRESRKLKVWAAPHELGTRTDEIIYCIDENPNAGSIKLVVNGITADFSIKPKFIAFQRSLLYHKYSACIRLSNRSPVSLHWSFQSLTVTSSATSLLLSDEMRISKMEGEIRPLQIEDVKFTYSPHTVDRKQLEMWVHVTDHLKRKLILEPRLISVMWESFDVAVDIELADARGLLDFGKVQYGSTVERTIKVKNKGVFDLTFSMNAMETDCSQGISFSPKSIFKMDSSSYDLLPDKTVDVLVTAHTDELSGEITLDKKELITVLVTDKADKENLIAILPIPVSIQVLTPRFLIVPIGELHFGPLLLYKTKKLYFQISNSGLFSFDFWFSVPEEKLKSIEVEPKGDEIKMKPALAGLNLRKNKLEKDESVNRFDEATSLIISPFVITMKSGTVLPNQIVSIPVTCAVDSESSYFETVLCKISNRPPGFEEVSLHLSAQGQIPTLRLHNLYFIFQEATFVCSSLETLSDIAEDCVTSYTVLATQDRSLLFANVPISDSCTIDLHLYNSSQVPAEVLMFTTLAASENAPGYGKTLTKSSTRRKDRPTSTAESPPQKPNDVFDLDNKEFTIAPLSLKKVQLSFKPVLIEEYKGSVSILLSTSPLAEQFTFSVVGQVTVPQISILEPSLDEDNKYLLTMNPTLLGMCSFQSFRLQNTCKVIAHVILEIFKNDNDVFSVVPSKDTIPLLLMDTDEILFTMLMDLKPGAIAEFFVQFKPVIAEMFLGEIHLHIRNNTYEKLVIHTIGLGLDDHLHVRGLDYLPLLRHLIPDPASASISRATPKKMDKRSLLGSSEIESSVHNYQFDMGAFPIEKEMWHSFQLGNTAKDSTWRFVFTWENSELTVFPSLGHLGPGTSGTFVIVMKCKEPSHGVVNINCIFTPIALEDSSEENWNISHSESQDINLLNAVSINNPHTDAKNRDIETTLAKKIAGKNKNPVSATSVKNLSVTKSPFQNLFGEPKYTVLKDHESMPLHINVKFVSDYVKFAVNEKNLHFSTCSCFEDKIIQVKVSNTGHIPVKLNSSLSLENYRRMPALQSSDLVAISSAPIEDNMVHDTAESHSTLSEADIDNSTEEPIKNIYSFDSLSSEHDPSFSASASDTDSREMINPTSPRHGRKSLTIPFFISPSETVALEPGQTVTYDVTFRPIQPFSYEAELGFHSTPMDVIVDSDQRTCSLEGTGSMPWVHLQLSAYDLAVTSLAQKNLDAGIRCLAFDAPGTNVTHTMKVIMTNVTAVALSYSWNRKFDQSESSIPVPPVFDCTQDSQLLLPGTPTAVFFTFHPYNLGEFESHWKLALSEDQSVDFLILGVAREPRVNLSQNFLKLPSCFVGALSTGTLLIKNKELYDLDYEFISTSLYSEGKQEILLVEPSSGILESRSSTRVRFELVANSSGDFLFNVECAVAQLLFPLLLCVSCEVFPVKVKVFITSGLGGHAELCPHEDNVILVGKINIRSAVPYQYEISNEGVKPLTFRWSHRAKPGDLLEIDVGVTSGQVEAQTTRTESISLLAHKDCVFDDETLVLHINHGPRYVIKFKGIALNLPYSIWPKEINFEACNITGQNPAESEQGRPYTRIVQCKNYSDEGIAIECYYQATPYLQVDVEDKLIEPNSTGTIRISFNPLQPKGYQEEINLLVNGKFPETLKVFGKGVELKVSLVNGEREVDFGLMHVGSLVTRTLDLINRGESRVSVSFDLSMALQKTASLKPTISNGAHKNLTVGQSSVFFQVLPRNLDLQANEIQSITIECKPTKIQKDIKLWLILNFEYMKKILCLVKGTVVGVSFLLDRNLIAFNPTKRACTCVEKLVLINNGDVGSKFEWTINQTSNYFKISPNRGFSNPGSVVHFNVEFTPSRPMLYLSFKATCKLEKHSALELRMTGSCASRSHIKDTLEFSTPVRTAATKFIQLKNSPVDPVISGYFFSGVKKSVGEKTFTYEVTYTPQNMTLEKKLHQGYVQLGNENSVIRLVGRTLPPLPNEIITASLPALQLYTQPLQAHNWLPYSQRFKCYFEFIPSIVGSTVDNYFSSKMIESITLPGNTDRNVDFCITPYRVAKLHLKVFLENEESQEYQWWDLYYEILSHDTDHEYFIDLASPARQTLQHKLVVENPMLDTTVFTASCTHPDVTVPEVIAVPGKEKGFVKVVYLPILEADAQETSVEILNSDLGRTIYHFHLTALAPTSEKQLNFSTELGKNVSQTVYLENLSNKIKTEFSLHVTHPDFIVDKSVQVLQDIKVPVSITYEPTSLESCEAVLQAKSIHAGTYTFPLLGEAMPPKPQGPYTIAPGDSIVLPFRNIFHEPKTFSYVVNNPLFTLKPTLENVKNKKDTKITVSLSQSSAVDCLLPPVAKLTASVAGEDRAEFAHMKWEFYLNTQC